MRQLIALAVCGLLLLSCAQAAEKAPVAPEPALRWFPGDCGVLAWPEAAFTANQRAEQAAKGGLTWMVVCDGVRAGVMTNPGLPPLVKKLKTDALAPILGLRWHQPRPVSEDVISIGIDPELPLPRDDAREMIRWTNRLGGAAILANPGRKLERYARMLADVAAVEAFSAGKWNPECGQGGAWDKMLSQGLRVFIVGGTSEATRPVLGRGAVATYVLSKSNAEADVVAAIRGGRVVVSERDNIRLNFTVNGRPPGSAVMPKDGRVEVAIDVRAREGVDEVKIIGNTMVRTTLGVENKIGVLSRFRVEGNEASRTFTLRLDKSTRYLRASAVMYKGVCQTLTNPVFVGARAPAPLPPSAKDKLVRLIGKAIEDLDWTKPATARHVVDELLADREVGLYATIALAKALDRKQLDRVRPLLESQQPLTRLRTAFVLGRVEGAAALASVLPLLKDRDGSVRTYAARLLATFAQKEHAEFALAAAQDPWHEVRRCGLVALARIPSAKSLFALRRTLGDSVASVKMTAATQLSLLLGLDIEHRDKLLKAFEAGTLDDELLNKAVAREDLRAFVKEAMAMKLRGVPLPDLGPGPGPKPAGAFRSFTARLTLTPPAVDGQIDDKIWDIATPVGKFVLDNGKPASQQTTVRALYDKAALYLLIECAEVAPKQILANQKTYDGNVWLDDSVDIYVCPDGDREGADPLYYRFSANALGTRFDERRQRRHWNAAWSAAGGVGEKAWRLEIKLPFGSLDVKAPVRGRTRWLINVARHRRVKPGEESLLAPGDPRRPAKYADLTFE